MRSATPAVAARPAAQAGAAAIANQASRSARTLITDHRLPTVAGARSATLPRAASAARAVGAPAAGYKACRDTYFQCMDEFCANKNAQLKRCACSARIHEFDNIKKNLGAIEDKMLDFSERLLAASMDKEDARAMSRATEGEIAFGQSDKSESQKILDGIMKKLQAASEETNTTRNLSAITLSMDMNVFDTIDSNLGMETAAKEGEALYRAALPICKEMAEEVCEEDEIVTVQNAYLAAIEQDCNVVAKTYASLKDKALETVREGSALLDMARLNNQQTRNSDDILACKKKMLDALSDSAVCGANLGKCLDWSGKYINPMTGAAILTSDLSKLAELIKRPEPGSNEKWVRAGNNSKFVQFLNTKRKYIAPAMKGCESLESVVWDAFLEDALAQIKVAQDRRLEDMRQGCTSITIDCMNSASKSLVDFDSRALSIFGVDVDRNTNQVCGEIKTACTALLNGVGTDHAWGEAMGNIATTKTLDQIITTCTEVGRNCFMRNCMNLESKFGLCQKPNAIMRTYIFTQWLCWDEVSKCVASAGDGAIENIIKNSGSFGTFDGGEDVIEEFSIDPSLNLYIKNINTLRTQAYPGTSGAADQRIWLLCQQSFAKPIDNDICRITERIWGNCDKNPVGPENTSTIIRDKGHYPDTLLAWLADNTNENSCNGNACEPGMIAVPGQGCKSKANLTDDLEYCPAEGGKRIIIRLTPEYTNCCDSGKFDAMGNCCENGTMTAKGDIENNFSSSLPSWLNHNSESVCSKAGSTGNVEAEYITTITVEGNERHLMCVGGTVNWNGTSGLTAQCSGRLVWVEPGSGLYLTPTPSGGAVGANATMFYKAVSGNTSVRCEYGTPGWGNGVCNIIPGTPSGTDNNLKVDIK